MKWYPHIFSKGKAMVPRVFLCKSCFATGITSKYTARSRVECLIRSLSHQPTNPDAFTMAATKPGRAVVETLAPKRNSWCTCLQCPKVWRANHRWVVTRSG